jgi:hypothetical protein
VTTAEPAAPAGSEEPERGTSAGAGDQNGFQAADTRQTETAGKAEDSAPSASTDGPASTRWWQKLTRSSTWQDPWQNCVIAVLFIGVLPLLPLIIEWFGRREISEDALIITTAVYSITVALASNTKVFFGAFLFASFIVASMYGFAASTSSGGHEVFGRFIGIRTYSYATGGANDNIFFALVMIGGFLSVVVERYSRHVGNREEFFEFLKSKRTNPT